MRVALTRVLSVVVFLALAGSAAADTPVSNPPQLFNGNPAVYTLGQGVGASAPADTNEDILATVTIPANMLGANGRLSIKAMWSTTNNSNGKTVRIRLGGISGTIYFTNVVTTSMSYTAATEIWNANSASSQVGAVNSHTFGDGPSSLALQTSAIDTTQTVTLVITGQKASSGDTITLTAFSVTIAPHS